MSNSPARDRQASLFDLPEAGHAHAAELQRLLDRARTGDTASISALMRIALGENAFMARRATRLLRALGVAVNESSSRSD